MRQGMHALLTILVLATLLAGCGGKNTDDEPLPDPHALLQESVTQLEQASSLELEIDTSGYPVLLDLELDLPEDIPLFFRYAHGVFQAPDRISASIQFGLGAITTMADMIILGHDHYFRGDVLTANRWINAELIPGFSPDVLFSGDVGIPHALNAITSLEMVGRQRLRGREVYYLRGAIQANAIYALTFGLTRTTEGELKIEVYVGTKDWRVMQLTLVEPPPNGADADEPTIWKISLLNYNKEVNITAPSQDDGEG